MCALALLQFSDRWPWPVGRMKFTSLEANFGGGQGLFSLSHSSFLSPSLWEDRGGNSPRFSIRKLFQLNPELGKKCSEITNKMLKRTKHP